MCTCFDNNILFFIKYSTISAFVSLGSFALEVGLALFYPIVLTTGMSILKLLANYIIMLMIFLLRYAF